MNAETTLSATEQMKQRTTKHLRRWWDRLISAKEQKKDGFGFFCSTSYVLRAGDAKLLIDPCLRDPAWGPLLSDTIKEDLRSFDAVLYTHEHDDHLDPNFLRLAAEADVRWIVPDFFDRDRLRNFGLSPDRVDFIGAGEQRVIQGTTVRAFASNHKRETETTFIRELGYQIKTAEHSYLFPCDVRTYDSSYYGDLVGSSPDVLFSHLWLGGGQAFSEPWEPKLTEYCRFIRDFAPKHTVIAHLYETARTPEEIWTWRHMGEAADRLLTDAPDTEVLFAQPGYWYETDVLL
ncbi:MAG: MBL fold metallo-hydrolase [Clostridia bacterium]|nr:MBL fold metallo-hydrolase [Clostridia bacterium]